MVGLQWYTNNSGCRVCIKECNNSNRGVKFIFFFGSQGRIGIVVSKLVGFALGATEAIYNKKNTFVKFHLIEPPI